MKTEHRTLRETEVIRPLDQWRPVNNRRYGWTEVQPHMVGKTTAQLFSQSSGWFNPEVRRATTDRQIFLDWCKKRKLKPEDYSTQKTRTLFQLPGALMKITLAGEPVKHTHGPITFYFSDLGEWGGGTNFLWDDSMPWVAAKTKRFRERMNGGKKS